MTQTDRPSNGRVRSALKWLIPGGCLALYTLWGGLVSMPAYSAHGGPYLVMAVVFQSAIATLLIVVGIGKLSRNSR